MRLLLTTLLMFLAAAGGEANAASHPASLRIMTFNVRTTLGVDDGPEAWPNRRDLFVATIRKAHPDLFGTQELTEVQADYVARQLPQYRWFGIDRRGGHSDEHMGIFYRADRLQLLDMGNFWLSDTPDVVGSDTWNTPFPRMVTWGRFEDRTSGRQFYLFNTHFPYRDEDEPARTKAARVLLSKIGAIAGTAPVVLTGDFNTTPVSEAYALIANGMTDVRKAAPSVRGPDETFHDFKGKADERIDWIFERGFEPLSDTTVTTHGGALYPSDHFPVLATLGWSAQTQSR